MDFFEVFSRLVGSFGSLCFLINLSLILFSFIGLVRSGRLSSCSDARTPFSLVGSDQPLELDLLTFVKDLFDLFVIAPSLRS